MSRYLIDRYHSFHKLYNTRKNVRVITSIIVGLAIFIISILISVILKPIFTSVFLATLLNDLPGLGLITGMVITFQMLGILPQPPKTEKKG